MKTEHVVLTGSAALAAVLWGAGIPGLPDGGYARGAAALALMGTGAALAWVLRVHRLARDRFEGERRALAERERHYRLLAENVTDLIWTSDLNLDFTFISPSILRLLGFSPEELIGRPTGDLLTPPAQKLAAEALRRELALEAEGKGDPNRPIMLELELLRRDGSSVWTETRVNFLRAADGKPEAVLGVTRDITRRRHARGALRRSEEKYRELVQNANSIIYRRDSEGRITFFNEFAQKFFGYSEAEILGRHVVGTIVPATDSTGRDLDAMIQDITVHTDQYATNENENVRRNGERVWVAWTNKAIQDASGRVAEVLCVGNDVTERKRAERLALVQRDLSLALGATANLDDALRLCLETAMRIADMDCGGVYQAEAATGDFVLTCAQGLPEAFVRAMSRVPADSPRLRELRQGRPIYFSAQENTAGDAILQGEGLQAVAALPVSHDSRVIGCINIASHQVKSIQLPARAALETIATQMGAAIAREKAKDALAQEAALWQNTFDAIDYLVALIDKDFRIVRANQAMRRAFPDRPVVGAHCYEVFHSAARPIDDCPTCKVFITGEATHTEHQERSLGNRYFDIYAYPVRNPANETVRAVHIASDITERKQAETEREATIHLLRLVNASSNLEALVKTATVFLREWSGCHAVGVRLRVGGQFPYFETHGFPARFEQVEPDFSCAEGATGPLGCVCRNILSGQFDPAQTFYTQRGSFWTNSASELLGAAGSAGWTPGHCCGRGYESIASIPLRSGGETFGLLQFSDKARGRFTHERIALLERLADNLAMGLAQRQAEEDRALLSSAVEQAAEAIVITDAAGMIQHVNPAFERTTGYRADETLGRSLDFLRGEKQGGDFYGALWEVLRRGEVWTGHFTNRRKDGAPVEQEATISPVRNAAGDVVHYIAVLRDVTHEIALEAQFRHAQKMEAVGRLAGGVAHDFNNLLTAIIGFSDLILDRLSGQSPVRKEVEQVKKAGERASTLVRQLLAFSRKQVMQPRVLDLNSVVADVEKMLRRLIGEDVEVRILRAPDLGSVRADPGQMEQVIMNLVVNARDAMPRGGQLTLRTANIDLDATFARQHVDAKAGPYVMLAVTDTGSGMDAETLGHIFEPFFTTKEQGRGTGLGLSTVYGIVTQSGGCITVESVPGQGATFRIFLPRLSGEAPDAAPNAARIRTLRGTETILLVEDEEVVRNLARIVLEGHGYNVLVAAGGEEALVLSARYPGSINLLITDIVMPGRNGHELAQELRPLRSEMKVMFMSGYLDGAIANQGLLGPDAAFIAKPFTPESFAAKVREVLDPTR